MPRSNFYQILHKLISESKIVEDYMLFSPAIYIKKKDSILQIINFDRGTFGFTCHLAVYPLVVPNKDGDIILSLGGRLPYLIDKPFERWPFERWSYGETTQEIEENIIDCINLLRKGILWFDEVDSEEKIVNYHVNTMIIHCPPELQNKYKGYCALYIGKIKEGVDYLEKSLSHYEKSKYDWAISVASEMREVISLALNDPVRLKEHLDSIVKASWNAIMSQNQHRLVLS